MAAALDNIGESSNSNLNDYYNTAEVQDLFNALINLCITNSPVEEQDNIAQQLHTHFTMPLRSSSNFYRFLSPLTPIPKPLPVKKKGKPKKDGKTKKAADKTKETKTKPKKAAKVSKSKSPRRRVSTTSEAGESSVNINNAEIVPSQDFMIQQVLKAIECSESELATLMLAKLIKGYAQSCRDTIGQRRLRRLARLDAANHCLKSLRSMLDDPNPSPTKVVAIDCLTNTLLNVSSKDAKIHLKIRLSGILPLLANRMIEAERFWTTPCILKFIARCGIRSVRNAQAMGREKDFNANLVTACRNFSALEIGATPGDNEYLNQECLESVQMLLHVDSEGADTVVVPQSFAVTTALKMTRLMEAVYLLAKNKKNKSQLIEKGILSVLVNIFHSHFNRRYNHLLHIEILGIVAGTIRLLSRLKKAKDELLLKLDGLAFVESCIRTLNEESKCAIAREAAEAMPAPGPSIREMPIAFLEPVIKLQDSLCALSMRWLPTLPFPMSPRPFPLTFPLPNGTTNPSSPGMPTASSSFKTPKSNGSSLLSHTLRNSLGKSPNKAYVKSSPLNDSAVDDGSQSSDDDGADEEDATLMFFGRRDGDDIDMLTPASEEDVDSDFGVSRRRGASGSNDTPVGLTRRALRSSDATQTPDVMKYSSQKLSDLALQYEEKFIEYENGAMPSDLSPKHRKMSITKKHHAFTSLVVEEAQKTLSVGDFVKIPYPDIVEISMNLQQQQFLSNPDSMRDAMLHRIARCSLENRFHSRVVFDLDDLIASDETSSQSTPRVISNDDASRIGRPDHGVSHLKFESRFESGNLRRAIQVAEHQYELIISPDINQRSTHYQWFYFEISNNKANVPYTFEIINFVKNTSMFSNGMQPVLFSVTEAQQGRPGWVRAGSSVCYFRNCYTPQGDSSTDDSDPVVTDKPKRKQRKASESGGTDNREKNYFSTRFTINFRHPADVCYIAYHYPYTYTYLRANLERHLSFVDAQIYVRQDKLTTTLAGNPVPILTITAPGTAIEVLNREVVIFSARVHPGESNSSWIMHGLLDFLMSHNKDAARLRELCVFKVIPMLNPDGVINGSHRCSLVGQDLNRVWDRPNAVLHPTIFNAKGIVQYCIDVLGKKPFVFVDLHGHSRRSNVFMYGNNPEESWRVADHSIQTNGNYLSLPEYLSQSAPGFSLKECRFNIAKSKESSARVALWRQFGIERCYTMESTYAGFDIGPYSGNQIGIPEHIEMGRELAVAVLTLKNGIESTGSLSRISSIGPISQANRRRSFTASTSMPPAAGTRGALRRAASYKSATNLSLSK